ncbi:hypothetical protein C8R45DRAFT_942338 [Mycena sanguinolenta]|nr:hypothetical protein C8R45DRAFT_942338 [Mycena sanguinolenta]
MPKFILDHPTYCIPMRALTTWEGYILLFLPPYSPHLNPIEESFSARLQPTIPFAITEPCVVKAYIRLHNHSIRNAADPILALLEACGCITAEKSRNICLPPAGAQRLGALYVAGIFRTIPPILLGD